MCPACPICASSARLTDINVHPQTLEQFNRNTDNYICNKSHEFEADVPLKLGANGYAIRADM